MNSSKHPDNTFPHRKISETFLEFSAPLLVTMPEEASAAEIEHMRTIAFTVWNVVVLHDVKGDGQYLERARATMAHAPGGATLVSQLVACKRQLFGGDALLVGKYTVRRKQGELMLRAKAQAVPAWEGRGGGTTTHGECDPGPALRVRVAEKSR